MPCVAQQVQAAARNKSQAYGGQYVQSAAVHVVATPNTSNALYFKRLHVARLLLRAVLQRVRFAPRPSRPLTRAAATELQHDYHLFSPLAHPV